MTQTEYANTRHNATPKRRRKRSSRPFFVPTELAERGLNSVHPFPLVMDSDKQIRGRRPALVAWREYPRVEINPPNSYTAIVLDVDDVDHLPQRAWSRGKPSIPPTWIVQALDSGKMHMGFILANPVHRNPESLRKPLLALADVADRLTDFMGADPGYGGLIARNPLAPGDGTHVYWQSYVPYTLKHLDKRVPKRRRPRRERQSGIGRNVDTFLEAVKVAHRPRWHRLIANEGWGRRMARVRAVPQR